jgi:competence protein ComEA
MPSVALLYRFKLRGGILASRMRGCFYQEKLHIGSSGKTLSFKAASELAKMWGKFMKKLFLTIFTLFALSGAAFAAVNINTAPQAELESLQGIGPAKAKAIVDHRKKNGPFKSADDLQNVNGIGPATIKRLRKDITVGSTATVKKDSKAASK